MSSNEAIPSLDPIGSKTDDEYKETPEGPTDSHVLSQVDQDEKGLAQKAGETAETTNVGWGESPDAIVEPLVAGLSNEDLWMLIRRFDKVCIVITGAK
jgi:hypothetical protein